MPLRATPRALLPALLLLAGACLAPAPGAGQDMATLTARILDDATGKPIPGAHVLVGLHLGAYADSTGTARVTGIPAGNSVVTFGMLGYATERILVQFEAGARVESDVRLTPEAVPLQPVSAAIPGRDPVLTGLGFYERASKKIGTFIYGDRLAKAARGSNRLSDVLLDVPGIKITNNGRRDRFGLVIQSARGSVSFNLKCYPPVYLDGNKAEYMSWSIDPDVNSIVPLNDVLGIEVYPDAALSPFEYDRSPCGIVVIWTRRRQLAPPSR